MTLYSVNISGRQYQVEIKGEQVRLNGQEVNTGLLPLDHPGLFRLTHDAHQRDMYLHHLNNGTYAITTEGRRIVADVEMKKAGDMMHPALNKPADGDLTAPMPGVVVNVHAAVGDRVESGQLLVTLESMKMQMEFRAPFAGQVAQAAVQPGQKVEKGALLVRLEK
jgi:biotin carboxyl carrier protein